jgi:ribose 5-phosphate isomerase A
MSREDEKEAAARASLAYVSAGQVVGLGSGSTAGRAVRLLGERVRAGLSIRGVPTSERTRTLAAAAGIPLVTLDEAPELDVTIDGADEVDGALRLIKGGGGALLREKIVAAASRRLVIVADSAKAVAVLGAYPLPVEIIPFARAPVARRIAALGAQVALRPGAGGGPYVTDEGHWLLDCNFGRIEDPEGLARHLAGMPGVVEHGLFLGMASVVLVGKGSAVEERRPGGAG